MGLPKFRFHKSPITAPEGEVAPEPYSMTAIGETKTAGQIDITPAAAMSPADVDTDEPPSKDPEDVPTDDAQRGIQDVEAVTLTWSKPSLIAVFIL